MLADFIYLAVLIWLVLEPPMWALLPFVLVFG
jgi:hypothetical protein